MNEPGDREIWNGIGKRFDSISRRTRVPERAFRISGSGRVRLRSRSRSARSDSKLAPLAVLALVIGSVAGWAYLTRPGDLPGATGGGVGDRNSPTANPPAAPIVGCGVTNLGPLIDEGVTPVENQRGGNEGVLGNAGVVIESVEAVSPRSYSPLLPKAVPGGRQLQLTLWLPAAEQIGLIYSTTAVTSETSNQALLKDGGYALTQRPFAGQDAELVMTRTSRNKWLVEVGPHPAALLWTDPVAEGVRPFRLYWADGEREWILIGHPDHPEELVDFARSIYC
jgi:hypothetical protein